MSSDVDPKQALVNVGFAVLGLNSLEQIPALAPGAAKVLEPPKYLAAYLKTLFHY